MQHGLSRRSCVVPKLAAFVLDVVLAHFRRDGTHLVISKGLRYQTRNSGADKVPPRHEGNRELCFPQIRISHSTPLTSSVGVSLS